MALVIHLLCIQELGAFWGGNQCLVYNESSPDIVVGTLTLVEVAEFEKYTRGEKSKIATGNDGYNLWIRYMDSSFYSKGTNCG